MRPKIVPSATALRFAGPVHPDASKPSSTAWLMLKGTLKLFWPLVLALLTYMGAVQIISVSDESQTFDEGFHLAAGYSYWKTGDFRINTEHPPLEKYWNALPLLFLKPKLPTGHPSWKEVNSFEFGREFLYNNSIDADTLLRAGRMMTVVMTLLLGLSIAIWTRRRFGPPAALFALALFAFDPNVIAHGRYITSDLPVTLFFFLACVTWGEYLITDRMWWLIASGLTIGLAICTKFSALILLPVFAILYGLRWWQRRPGKAHCLRSFLIVGVLAYAVVVTMYFPQAASFVPGIRLLDHSIPAAADTIQSGSALGNSLRWISGPLGLGRNAFFEGVSLVAWHNQSGRQSYLLGKQSETGWWYYFPIVMLVKSPTGLLIGLAACAWLLARFAVRARWREVSFAWFVLAVPTVLYFAASVSSRIDIGVRHLLPIFPFLFVTIAAFLWRDNRRAILVLVVALVAIESVWIHPYYLAFFNLPSGGPSAGPRYLVDSNIDWGQDLRRLKAYLDKQGNPEIYLLYFGAARAEDYGIHLRYLPPSADVQGRAEMDGLAAISVTPLMGPYVNDDRAWLRKQHAVANIGHSIYVYDFRKPPQAATPLPGR